VTVDFRTIPSKYALTLMYPQNCTEALLFTRLRELGGDVVRPAEMTAMAVQPQGVTVDIAVDGNTRRIATQWLVGCDGMNSRVREAAGIPFVGGTYEEGFVLADVRMDWPLERDEVSLFFSPEGLVVVAPLPDNRYRIVATADDAPEQPTLPFLQALLDARGPKSHPARISDIVWTSRFRVHDRVAETPRKGRVLLCGDAAHVHSPAGGQGMNTGIQDAISLAAVLADVEQGGAESQLEEWAGERHRIAQGVVSLTDRATRMATLRSPIRQTLRNIAMDLAGHVPAITRALAKRIAELDSGSKR
jgi:2-polyprenyl-6-methoxyphenol hydroxylase-like FAD-dependent oxidoreductase